MSIALRTAPSSTTGWNRSRVLPTSRSNTGHRLNPHVRPKDEHVCAVHAWLAVGTLRNPIRKHRSLAVPDVALPLHAEPGHEPLRGAEVRRQIVNAVQQAESITKLDTGSHDLRESRLTLLLVRNDPG